jgi:hypothetical protein
MESRLRFERLRERLEDRAYDLGKSEDRATPSPART